MDPDYPVNRMYLEELLKENTKKLVDLKSRMTHQHVAVHTHIAWNSKPGSRRGSASGRHGPYCRRHER